MMDPIAAEVSAGLSESKIEHYATAEGSIRVPLPNGFGELEIGVLDTKGMDGIDSIVGLVGHSWHTHGDVLAAEHGGNGHVDGILRFVSAIFRGELVLVETSLPGGSSQKTILRDFDRYLDDLPTGAGYKVYNPA